MVANSVSFKDKVPALSAATPLPRSTLALGVYGFKLTPAVPLLMAPCKLMWSAISTVWPLPLLIEELGAMLNGASTPVLVAVMAPPALVMEPVPVIDTPVPPVIVTAPLLVLMAAVTLILLGAVSVRPPPAPVALMPALILTSRSAARVRVLPLARVRGPSR